MLKKELNTLCNTRLEGKKFWIMSSILRILYTEKKCNEIVIKGKTVIVWGKSYLLKQENLSCVVWRLLKLIMQDYGVSLLCLFGGKNNLVNAFLLWNNYYYKIIRFQDVSSFNEIFRVSHT